jgi:transcriptional antiterminator Rof (Rho-off)
MIHYTPIACSLHESLELAILTGRRLRVRLHRDSPHSPGGTLVLEPVDLSIAEAAEWLDARDGQGQGLRLRLDWIVDAELCI